MKCPVKPIDARRPRVMVVDDGFDVRHPAFAGKMAGCYQVECPSVPDFELLPGEPEDAAAARYAAYLATPSPECSVTEGFTLNIDAYLERFEPRDRDYWNAGLLNKQRFDSPAYTPEAIETLFDLTGSGDYHGTASAGAVAYQNDVDLVLVQIKLGSADDLNLPCLHQADVDLETKLLMRPEVAKAYVEAPLDGRELRLYELRRQHGVRVENRSFGPLSRRMHEFILFSSRCPRVTLEENYRIVADLYARRDTYLRETGAFAGTETLILQSAGNDAEQIDRGVDSLACTAGRVDRALVGSYDIYRNEPNMSFFSNYGECVDLYAFGHLVILPSAAGFYSSFTGTSFSSPLAARYASTLAPLAPTTTALRDLVFGARDENRFLPLAAMPTELAFFTLDPVSAPKPTKMALAVPIDGELGGPRVHVRRAAIARE
jgi:subtilisin family serine protease